MIKALLYENNDLSLTRSLALAGFLAFLAGSIYLLAKGTTWGNYDTFATLTGGGGAATQIANKLINGKYNSEQGKPFEKGMRNAEKK